MGRRFIIFIPISLWLSWIEATSSWACAGRAYVPGATPAHATPYTHPLQCKGESVATTSRPQHITPLLQFACAQSGSSSCHSTTPASCVGLARMHLSSIGTHLVGLAHGPTWLTCSHPRQAYTRRPLAAHPPAAQRLGRANTPAVCRRYVGRWTGESKLTAHMSTSHTTSHRLEPTGTHSCCAPLRLSGCTCSSVAHAHARGQGQ